MSQNDGIKAADQALSTNDKKQVKSDDFEDGIIVEDRIVEDGIIVECPLCTKLFSSDHYGKLDDHVLKCHAEIMVGKDDGGPSPAKSPPSSIFDGQPKRTVIQTASRFGDSTNHCEKLPTNDENMISDLMFNFNSNSGILEGRMDAPQNTHNCGLRTTSIGSQTSTAQVNTEYRRGQATVTKSIYYCPLCPFTNNGARVMARHIILEHSSCSKSKTKHHGQDINRFSCPKCSITCKSLSKLVAHTMQVHTDYLPFACTECSFKTKTNDSLQRHILRKHQELGARGSISIKIYRCPECPRILKSNSELIMHTRVHTGERPFPCSECSYKAKQKRHLKAHIKNRHQKDKTKEAVKKPKTTYRCPDCPLVFDMVGRFLEHTRTHTGDKLFNCSVCGHKTRFNHELKTHMTLHQDIGNGKFESRTLRNCPHCPYMNFSLSKLTEHIKLHDGEHPYECNECDYKAKSEEHLKYHKTIHQNGKLFKCSECDYATNNENAFSNHMKVHSGEQKYSCQECSRTFKYKLLLNRHMANAHNVKPFKCPEPNCDFATAVKYSLEPHAKLHLGEPCHFCIECDYKCHTLAQLYNHEAGHYGKGPFKCPDCSFVSIHRASIRRHRKEGGRGYTCVVITRSKKACS